MKFLNLFLNYSKNEIGIENFEFINLIGKGAFGRVYLVKRKQTGDQYAMKIINTMDNVKINFFFFFLFFFSLKIKNI